MVDSADRWVRISFQRNLETRGPSRYFEIVSFVYGPEQLRLLRTGRDFMLKFDFRLRFHFTEGNHIKCDAEELVLLEDDKGRRLRLKSGRAGEPIKEQSRAALIGGPYDSEMKPIKLQTPPSCVLLSGQ